MMMATIPTKMNSLPFQVNQNMNDIKDLKAQTNQNIADITNLKQAVEDVSVLANNLNNDVTNLYVEIAKITPLKFTNITVSTWVSDTTYADYPYKGTITLTGVTSSMIAEVIFNVTDAESGNYAPICETFDGGVYIYSKVNSAITIPTILVVK